MNTEFTDICTKEPVSNMSGTQMNTEFTEIYTKKSVPICVNPCPINL